MGFFEDDAGKVYAAIEIVAPRPAIDYSKLVCAVEADARPNHVKMNQAPRGPRK